MQKIRAVVSGTIQNVGYRAKVIGFAKAFELTGFVHNLDDGRVRIIAEGEKNNLNAFIDAIQITNTLIKVDGAEVEYGDVTGDLNDFYKLVGGGETDERLDKAAEYLTEMIDVTRTGFSEMKLGFETMGSKMDAMLETQSAMLETQSAMLEKQSAMLEKQIETTEEIRGLREDMKSYMDRKFGAIEDDLSLIKSTLKASGMLN